MLKLPRNFHVVCSRAMTKQRDVAVLLCGFINLQLFIYFVILGAMGNLRQVDVDEDALSDFKVPFFLSICLSVHIEDRLSVFVLENDNLHVLQKINYCMSFTFIFPFHFNLSLFSYVPLKIIYIVFVFKTNEEGADQISIYK